MQNNNQMKLFNGVLIVFCFYACSTVKKNSSELNYYLVEYYSNFDFINMEPEGKIDNPHSYPYLKVLKDSSQICVIEAFLTQSKKPDKVYKRIYFKGLKAYATSTINFKEGISVDTMISLKDELYEFRNYYYPDSSSRYIKAQSFFYYKKLRVDSVSLNFVKYNNHYKNASLVFKADTTKAIRDIYKPWSDFNDGFYAIFRVSNRVIINCANGSASNCLTGNDSKNSYPFINCIYWSLFNHSFWKVVRER